MMHQESRLPVIEGEYLNDILKQPEALRRTWDGLRAENGLVRLVDEVREGKFPFVILTGMGASYFACYPLLLKLTRQGIVTLSLETSSLVHERAGLLAHRPLVIAVSQSGASAEMIRLLELAGSRSPILGLTNTPDSPLARGSSVVILTRAGSEATVSCKTYLATLMALEWLGDLVGGRNADAELEGAAGQVQDYLEGWSNHVAEAAEMVSAAKHLFLVGRGTSMAAVGTGGLIIKEATRRAAEGMSSAAFRHGPLEMIGHDVFVAVFQGEGDAVSLNRRLALEIKEAGGIVAEVGSMSEKGWRRLPAGDSPTLPILEILPVQMLTLALAALSGREAGRFGLARKITDIE